MTIASFLFYSFKLSKLNVKHIHHWDIIFKPSVVSGKLITIVSLDTDLKAFILDSKMEPSFVTNREQKFTFLSL